MLQEVEVFLLGPLSAGYLVAWLAYWQALRTGRDDLSRWASLLTWAVWLLQATCFGLRVFRAGHLPIYSAYEFSLTFAGGMVLAQLIFERLSRRWELGLFVLPVALALLLYSGTLPKDVETLIPIFRSLWLKVHIVTAFVAYSCLGAAFAASCLYLIRSRFGATRPTGNESGLRILERVGYQAVSVGFSFLTACIVSGAIWAEFVWGRFWSWDPKETWSLITWLIFAAYLHARHQGGWKGRRVAVLGVVGFLLVLTTYVGVDSLIPRLHDFR